MCNPVALGWAALAVTAVGGVYQADATRKQGQAIEEQSEEDAKLADAQSEQAKQAGLVEEEKHLRRVRQAIGTQRATAAANGLDPNEGTPLDLQADTAGFGAQDATTIRMNAMRQAYGFDVQGINALNRGSAARATGRNQATGTILTTAAKNTGQAYSFGLAG